MIDLASDILERDLLSQYSASNPNAYSRCEDMQIAAFLTNHMALGIMRRVGMPGDISLGHGIGEYNHLVHIGALDLVQALKLVSQRGKLLDESPRGMMARVQSMELKDLEDFLHRVKHLGAAEISCHMAPGQHMISGELDAMKAAVELIKDESYARVDVMEAQAPAHCAALKPVEAAFLVDLEGVQFSTPRRPYLPNTEGVVLPPPSREEFMKLLAGHLHRPVLWRQSIDFIVARWPDAVFVEIGPGQILHDLLDPDWHANRRYHVDSKSDLALHLDRLVSELLILAPAETM